MQKVKGVHWHWRFASRCAGHPVRFRRQAINPQAASASIVAALTTPPHSTLAGR